MGGGMFGWMAGKMWVWILICVVVSLWLIIVIARRNRK